MRSVLLLLHALPVAFGAPAGAANPERPNVIFIMADDLGYADLGCYGQKEILTPNIDRLAAEGRRFTQVYAGSTVCAPSRSVLMTGQHTGHTRVRGNSARVPGGRGQILVPLEDEDVTVAEVLRQAGYATGVTGKWGLGEPGTTGVPNRQGFDEWLGFLNQVHAHTYYPEFLWKNGQMQIIDGNLGGHRRQWVHDLFTGFALDFIERHQAGPFFLYVAYTIPHGRYEIPGDAPYSDKPWPESLRNYAAMITRMDRDVGRILGLLEKLGIDRRTVVFFTSDNGAEVYYFRPDGLIEEYAETFHSGGPLRGYKRDLYEGGIRVPMIVRWPGRVPAGTTSDQVWAFWDFLPTAAELAGVEPPQGIDGVSMVPALLGKPQKSHEFLYWEFFERGFQQAVRYGDWKALRLEQGKPLELYDLRNDVGEEHNVAREHPDVAARIEAYLKAARTESEYWPPR